jgi:hypothetical protein
VRFLFRLLWRKVLVFFAGARDCMSLVGYKGLPQGSVLSPFLYNIIGSCADRFIPSGCGFLQYADDLVVYMAHRLFNVARGLVQTACTSLNVFFSSMGQTISASKSEVMLFTRKHERSPILVRIGSYVLPQTICFKYLVIFFDAGLRWSCSVKYLGSASCLILLYGGIHWIGPGIWLGLFYEYGKGTYAGFGKGSVPGI